MVNIAIPAAHQAASLDSSQVKVGLVQINHPYSGQSVLPYSVGLLQAYAEANGRSPSRFSFQLPIHAREPIGSLVDALVGCDVVGFSTYVWNGRISLEIARRLRERSKNVVIVFGGPHVPDESEDFLRRNGFIDVAVHNEGERSFLKLLEQYPHVNSIAIDGTSFVDGDGEYHKFPNAPRIRNLESIPSPFLTGVFDRLMELNPKHTWVALWETNRGCPFQCTFCDWGSATATKVSKFELERLQREIDWFSDKRIQVVYCCDANFGILKRDIDVAKYAAEAKRSTGYPRILSVQNTKNATERAYETQKILSDAALTDGIALAMQSLDPNTLKSIKRDNISLEVYDILQHRFMSTGVDTYSDLIIGLPGETYSSFVNGVNTLIERGQHTRIRFNNLSILPNAEMGSRSYQEKHGIVTIESQLIILPSRRDNKVDDVEETQTLVIGTANMPSPDWRRSRVFAWMTTLLYFDKLLQIPFAIAHSLVGVRYTDLIEVVIEGANSYPILAELRAFFEDAASAIQRGEPEYPFSEQWLSMYWPTDEYAYIGMIADKKIDAFYDEVQALLTSHFKSRGCDDALPALADAFLLNRSLIKRPFVFEDKVVATNHNIMDVYESVLAGRSTPLERAISMMQIMCTQDSYSDIQIWCREAVMRSKQKGAYFYRTRRLPWSKTPGNELRRPELQILDPSESPSEIHDNG